MRNFVGNSAKTDDAMEPTPHQSKAGNRVPIPWSEESYRVSEVVSNFPLPCVAAYDSRAYYVSRERSNIDFSQPFLFYAARKITKVTAVSLVWEDRSGEYKPLGDPLIVPADYAGWFEVVSGSCRDDDGQLLHFRDIGSIAVSECSKFLIGGTEHVDALLIKGGNLEDTGNHLHHRLLPGDILKVGPVYAGKATKQKWIDRVWKKTTKKESFLQCRDEKEREVLIPINASGRFYSICERGNAGARGVRQISDILKTCRLPCIVRLAFGEVPSTRCLFTGTLKLESKYVQSSVLASTLYYMRNIFVEIPSEIPLKFRVAESSTELTRSDAYQNSLRMCEERIDDYKKKIKVSCLIDTTDSVVDSLASEDEDQEEKWTGVPHVPPKTPGLPGVRESFLQSLECTGRSPTPTPPDRRKKKSTGISPTVSPASADRRTARCKSESGVVDSDYERIWLPRHRAGSAAANISPLPHASHPPALPGSDSPIPPPVPHLGGRTSPDGGEMAPALDGKDQLDSPQPCKPSPYVTPPAPVKVALENRRSSLEPLDGDEATVSKRPESSTTKDPCVNISSRIPLHDVSLHGATTSQKIGLTSVDELSVVPPPPPPPQENKPGKRRDYVNVTHDSHVASVGVAVSVSARDLGKEGGQVGLGVCPPPPIPVHITPPKDALVEQGNCDDVNLLSGQQGHPLSRSTRHSIRVMVQDSCVYLPMEMVDDTGAPPSQTWTLTPPTSLDHTPNHAAVDIHTSSNPDGDVYVFADGLQAPCSLKPPNPKYLEHSEDEVIYQNISDLRPLVLGEDRSPGEKAKVKPTPTSYSSPDLYDLGQRNSDWRKAGEQGYKTVPTRKTSSVTPYENVPIPHPDLPRPKSYAEGFFLEDMPPLPCKISGMAAGPPLPPKTPGLIPARMTLELWPKFTNNSSNLPELQTKDRDAPPLPVKKRTQSFNMPPSRKPLIRSRTLGDLDDGDRDYDIPCPSQNMTGSSNYENSRGSTGSQPPSVSMDDDHDYEIPRSDTVSSKARATCFDRDDYDIPVPFVKEATKLSSPQTEKPVTPPRVRNSHSSGQLGLVPQTTSPQKAQAASSSHNRSPHKTTRVEAELSKVASGEKQKELQSVPEEDQPEDRPKYAKANPVKQDEPKSGASDANAAASGPVSVVQNDNTTEEQTLTKDGKDKTQSDQVSSEIKADEKEGKGSIDGGLKEKQQSSERDQSTDEFKAVARAKPTTSKPAVLKKPVISTKPQLSPKSNVRKSVGTASDKPKPTSAKMKRIPIGTETQINDKSAAAVSSDEDASMKAGKPALKSSGNDSKSKSEMTCSEDSGIDLQLQSENPFLPKGGLKPVSERSRSDSFHSKKTAESGEKSKKTDTVEKMAAKCAGDQVPDSTKPSTLKKPGPVFCGKGKTSVKDEKSHRPGEGKSSHTAGNETKRPSTVQCTDKDKLSCASSASGSASRPLAKVRSEESNDEATDTLTKMTSQQLIRALAKVGLRQETLSLLEAEKVDGKQLCGMEAVDMRNTFPMLRNIDIKKIQMYVHGWRPKD